MRGKAQLQQAGTKRGAWSPDEDASLREVVRVYGHGRWNSLAQAAGLQRTGKSCRLRWLNYLRPNVRHGGFSLDEQLFILQLHLCWGNRWAKIAEQLPGRTDNDIKNYWRTRILKHAKHLNCDVNSPQFKHVVRDVWIPTLVERITSGSGLYMGHAHLPLNSPQDVGGPDATEKPMPECGSSEDVIGPVGLNEAQNSPFGMGNGPDFDPFVFESSSPLWTPCELELELDFEMRLGSEED